MEATFYMPLTAAPFRKNEVYKEVLPKNPEIYNTGSTKIDMIVPNIT